MLKTIKVKKQLRLDELINYVWENNEIFKGRTHIKFTSNSNCPVIFGVSGHFETNYGHDADDTFTVEVEKEITRNTPFEWLVEVNKSGVYEERRCSISAIEDEDTIRIYALLDEELKLIWEAE